MRRVAPGERLRVSGRGQGCRAGGVDRPRSLVGLTSLGGPFPCPATEAAPYNVDDGGSNFAFRCAGPPVRVTPSISFGFALRLTA